MPGKPYSRQIAVGPLPNANPAVIVLPVTQRGSIARLEVTEVGGTNGFSYAVYEGYAAFTPAIDAPLKYATPVFPTAVYVADPAYRVSPVLTVAPGSASYAGTQPWDGKFGLAWAYTNRDGSGDTDAVGFLYLHLTPTGSARSYTVNITVCEPGAGPG